MLFDEPSKLSTKVILDWHATCSKGLDRERKEAYSSLTGGVALPAYLLDALLASTKSEIDEYYECCVQELDISTVLILIASAEARIRLDALNRKDNCNSPIAGRLKLLFAHPPKSWQVSLYEDGIMDAWKDYFGQILPVTDRNRLVSSIGSFKSMLQVRHWVAHGRYWEPKHQIKAYPPVTVAKLINSLYSALHEVTIVSDIRQFESN